MKVLMFGWEFPPFNTGGLGTACYGLTKGLSRQGVEITLVLPRIDSTPDSTYMKILSAKLDGRIHIRPIDSLLKPYVTSQSYDEELRKFYDSLELGPSPYKQKIPAKGMPNLNSPSMKKKLYGSDLYNEVYRYSKAARKIAAEEDYDVIHCHDWLTYPAGVEAQKVARSKGNNAPLITHVHATEFDRTGGNPNSHVYHIERAGMNSATYVIAISNYTKNLVTSNYGISPDKVHVAHNSIDHDEYAEELREEFGLKKHHKVVLFLGRMTIQKGPDHFLNVAKKVSDLDPNVRFVMAGDGDMFTRTVEQAANLGIGDKVLFAEHLSGRDVDRAYRMADVYVMSSISEPFGLTVLEAMKNRTPVIVSKQSGVTEVVKNCLTVDFWDQNEMTNKILSVLHYPGLHESLSTEGYNEVRGFSWDSTAKKCMEVYDRALNESRR
jgi:glycogen(starch) synthase